MVSASSGIRKTLLAATQAEACEEEEEEALQARTVPGTVPEFWAMHAEAGSAEEVMVRCVLAGTDAGCERRVDDEDAETRTERDSDGDTRGTGRV